jgi:hypothetical protein
LFLTQFQRTDDSLESLPEIVQAKKRDWQTGTLLGVDLEEASASSSALLWHYSHRLRWWIYTVDAADVFYEFQSGFHFPLNETIGRPLIFAFGEDS